MIIRPSTARLIEVVRSELRDTIRPALPSRALTDSLDMIDAILLQISVRSESELPWINEEIDDVVAIAREVVDAGYDTDHTIEAALSRLATIDRPSIRLADAHESYDLASEILSLATEAVVARDSVLRERVLSALSLRSKHERAVRGGAFHRIGRG